MNSETAKLEGVEVLLVEDNPVDIMLTRRVFKAAREGHNMHIITDGEEALDFLYQRNKHSAAPEPHLILLDLNLPKKGGMEVLAEIKQDPNLSHIPIVVFTNSSSREEILKSHQLHANCFVTKPTDYDEFEKAAKMIEDFWLSLAQLPGPN